LTYGLRNWEESQVETAQSFHEHRSSQGFVGWEPLKQDEGLNTSTISRFFLTGGHLLKNQSFYRVQDDNLWNDPIHAGPKSWRFFHGPNTIADAPLLDEIDKTAVKEDAWKRKREFVNASRERSLERTDQRRQERHALATWSSWAPTPKGIKDILEGVNDWTDLNSMPPRALQKIITPMMLHKDREAIEVILDRLQDERDREDLLHQWRNARREEIRTDLAKRKAFNDLLEELSGQYGRMLNGHGKVPRLSTRLKLLAQPKEANPLADIQAIGCMRDFKDLLYADYKSAVDVLQRRSPPALRAQMGEISPNVATIFKKRWQKSTTGLPPPPAGPRPQATLKPATGVAQEAWKGLVAERYGSTYRVSVSHTPTAKPFRPSQPGSEASTARHKRQSRQTTARTGAPSPEMDKLVSAIDAFEQQLMTMTVDTKYGNDFKYKAKRNSIPAAVRRQLGQDELMRHAEMARILEDSETSQMMQNTDDHTDKHPPSQPQPPADDTRLAKFDVLIQPSELLNSHQVPTISMQATPFGLSDEPIRPPNPQPPPGRGSLESTSVDAVPLPYGVHEQELEKYSITVVPYPTQDGGGVGDDGTSGVYSFAAGDAAEGNGESDEEAEDEAEEAEDDDAA